MKISLITGRSVFVFLVLGLWAGFEARCDWPEFRGPGRQGVAPEKLDPPIKWSSTESVVWKTAVPGNGWSSPVVVDETIILTTAELETNANALSLKAVSLDVGSGQVKWETTVFNPSPDQVPNIHRKNSHASPTPIIEADRVYVHFGHHGTAALDLKGRILWKNNDLFYPPTHGNGGSPVIWKDLLIFNCDGGDKPFIAALNKHSGELVWKKVRDTHAKKTFSFCTPLVIELEDGDQLITPGSGMVNSLDPATGKEFWRVEYGEGYSVVPRPVYGNGLLYIATGFDRPNLLCLQPGPQSAAIKWEVRRGAPLTPSPLLAGDELYLLADNGVASCLDAQSGEIHWQERIGGSCSSSPLLASGKVYFQDEEGNTTVVKAAKTFEILSRNEIGERTLASFALDANALLIRTENHLYKIGKP